MSDWEDSLSNLSIDIENIRKERLELDAENRKEDQANRKLLLETANNLELESLLQSINEKILHNNGIITINNSWESETDFNEPEPEPNADEQDEEDTDYISYVLDWDEDGEREIAIDIGLEDGSMYLEINGHDVALEAPEIQQMLINVIQEELEI
ncbi:MAG TPA: hypothetical protein DEZ08_00640 [Dehalococcoidia bacterium]|nr:hypothetical protein [Dehalococcoidia bacterium]|tara:strand:+ start:2601 stop:3065 length:465 start_codon:yes stop_codon:yes gene_type:complete